MQGMELCRRFYEDCVRGVLARRFAGMEYSAGLLGFGSDVLGYDDEVSRDHMWGPRLYIFLDGSGAHRAGEVYAALARELPRRFMGFSVDFGTPDGGGISAMREGGEELHPLIRIGALGDYLASELGVTGAQGLRAADWLALSEHKLLTLREGRLFHDGLGLERELRGFYYYPHEVWLYLLMSDWACLAEERAFVKRTASRGDELGSRIICARIAQRIMHLCFLYERRYAPYAKWLGTAFAGLGSARRVAPLLERALGAGDPLERERAIAEAQAAMIELHNEAGLTAPVSPELHRYYGRDILVADSDSVQGALRELLRGTELESLPPLGSLSAVGNLVELTESADNLARVRAIYERPGERG